ncbi:MAG: hypothetical protein QW158_06760 [Nitrososphaerales archaeon]
MEARSEFTDLKRLNIPAAKIRLPVKLEEGEGLKKLRRAVKPTSLRGNVFFCPSCRSVFNIDFLAYNLCPKCKRPLEERFQIHLRDLSAQYVGKKVLIKTMVAGESPPKAFHPSVKAYCDICGKEAEANLLSEDAARALAAILSRDLTVEQVMRDSLPQTGCSSRRGKHFWIIEEVEEPFDYREIFLRDIIGLEEVAERSVTARNYRAYLLGKPPAEKKVYVEGEVVVAPKSSELILLVRNAFPLGETAEGFKLKNEDIQALKQLQRLNYEALLSFADRYVAPKIVGREYAKLSSLLAASSVTWIKVGKGFPLERGCLRVLFVGDPRTAKGSIVEWYSEELGVGEHGVGEAASRAGLLYYIDPESNTLIWGLLVQSDLSLVGIEGLHGLPSEQLAEFRESLHNMRVEVSKKVSGSAWARCRIIADANSRVPMSCEVYPALAVTKVECLRDPVDITRWDLIIPFSSTDVPAEKIAEGGVVSDDYEEKLHIIRKLIYWAWSRKIDQIHFTEEALKEAKTATPKLINEYAVDEVPLIHNAILGTILRLACSFAVLTFSSPDGEKLEVKTEHVVMADRLLKELAEMWDLAGLKHAYGKTELTEEEREKVEKLLKESEVVRRVLIEIAVQPVKSNILALKLQCNASYLRDKVGELKASGLVKSTSQGYALTPKGALVVRNMILNTSPSNSPSSPPNKTNSQKGRGVFDDYGGGA